MNKKDFYNEYSVPTVKELRDKIIELEKRLKVLEE